MSLYALSTLALFSACSWAQQYAGDTISGYLPTVPNAEVAYFRISDPSSVNDRLTLINYQSLGSNGQRLQESNIQRAVIMMSGQRRDADVYIGYVSLLCHQIFHPSMSNDHL